jgi:hypothetical protein
MHQSLLALGVVRRWPSVKAKRWAASTLCSLASSSGTYAIVAIGSAVRPAHHPRSDVDFLIITDAEVKSASSRPIDVDLRVFRSWEVDQKLNQCDDLLGWAMRFGCVVFDRDQYWTNLCARWAARLPFPSPEASVARAYRFERLAREMISVGDFDAALEQVVAMLTHRSRASLLRAQVYPVSRPELPAQLRKIGDYRLAESLERALRYRQIAPDVLHELKFGTTRSAESTS